MGVVDKYPVHPYVAHSQKLHVPIQRFHCDYVNDLRMSLGFGSEGCLAQIDMQKLYKKLLILLR